MTTASPPPTPGSGVAKLLNRLGLKVGGEVELELLVPAGGQPGALTVVGRLEELIVVSPSEVAALAVRTTTGVVSVVPWHAVARIVLRTAPAHPAL